MDKSLFDKYIQEMRTMRASASLPTQNNTEVFALRRRPLF